MLLFSFNISYILQRRALMRSLTYSGNRCTIKFLKLLFILFFFLFYTMYLSGISLLKPPHNYDYAKNTVTIPQRSLQFILFIMFTYTLVYLKFSYMCHISYIYIYYLCLICRIYVIYILYTCHYTYAIYGYNWLIFIPKCHHILLYVIFNL